MFKKMVALLLVCCFAMSFVACGDKDGDDVSKPKTSKIESVNESESISEIESSTVTESSEIIESSEDVESSTIIEESVEESEEISEPEVKLSDSCEMVLASGIDIQGNVYELVGNDTETYAGVQVEIGVIKNNEWLVELTSDMPLVDEDGTLYGEGCGGLDDAQDTIFYIGNGCFIYRFCLHDSYSADKYYEVVYNAENGKHYIQEEKYVFENKCLNIIYEKYDSSFNTNWYAPINEDGYVSVETSYSDKYYNVKILNTTTMETTKIQIPYDDADGNYSPLSEGLIAVTDSFLEVDLARTVVKFYDIYGNLVLDMSEFDICAYRTQKIVFVDGKCTYKIRNNAGNYYEITIDKQGNVIDSRPLS